MNTSVVATVKGEKSAWSTNTAAAPIGAYEEFNPHDKKGQVRFPNYMLEKLEQVPADGTCLFHCLYESYKRLADRGVRFPVNFEHGFDMRQKVCNYMLRHSDKFEVAHGIKIIQFVDDETGLRLSFPEVMKMYVSIMRNGTTYGGLPEIDAAAMMMNVCIQTFEQVTVADTWLISRCYPERWYAMGPDEKARIPVFIFVMVNPFSTAEKFFTANHYKYLLPNVPRGLKPDEAAAAGSRATGSGAAETPARALPTGAAAAAAAAAEARAAESRARNKPIKRAMQTFRPVAQQKLDKKPSSNVDVFTKEMIQEAMKRIEEERLEQARINEALELSKTVF
jgi:hypothetical protein